MPIIVTCPECRKSFKVNDKFAGKSGPCPSCKHVLQVPEQAAEVKVHAPKQFAGGGRSTKGKLLLKPEAFAQTKFQPATMAIIAGAALGVLLVAWVGGRAGLFQNAIVAAIGLLLVSPPLAVGGYVILRNPELEPYRGTALYVRSAICALAYILLWGVFAYMATHGMVTGEVWVWLAVGPPFVLAGGGIALATLELEYGSGVFHYCFYVLATVVLHQVAGLQWAWNAAR